MGKILFFFLPKAPKAPKKTKICGTSPPAKICPQWGLNQLPYPCSALFYHSPMTQICQTYAIQGSYLDMLSKKSSQNFSIGCLTKIFIEQCRSGRAYDTVQLQKLSHI